MKMINETPEEKNDTPVIHNLDKEETGAMEKNKLLVLLLVVILVGLGLGYLLNRLPKRLSSSSTSLRPVKKTAGIADKKTFKDQAEGILKEGGIDGEGSFHLDRPGGVSQNVYLTSTTVDLAEYVGRKIRVWGETFGAAKAGWLMDVGLVEVL
ncbi:hypothetical protein HY214_00295 [Candidatus Roizmanbacteria bacterium]|nr:hypothetical protein [Candidatus Roizmanbacteria bacterium]